MIALGTVLHLALPPLSILAMGRFAPRRGVVWMVVAGLALYEFLLLSFGLLLGYLGLLGAPGPLVLWGLVAAVLLASAVRGVGPAWRAARAALAGVRLHPVDACLGLAVLAMAYLTCLQIARDWTEGSVSFDALTYHIPRALVWSWHGNVHPFPTADWHRVGLPVGGDLLLLPGVLLGIGWLGAGWTTTWLSLGGAAAVFAVTRTLGAGRRPSLVAALAFLSFPAVGMRFVDVSTDMAAAFPIVAASALAVRARSVAEAAFLFPPLCAVGVASKGNVALAPLVLAIAIFGSRLRALLDRRVLAAAVAGTLLATLLCAGSYLPVYRLFRDLMGGWEGRILVSYLGGLAQVARAALFNTLHWLVEPFAVVPEPPRFDLLNRLGLGYAYRALGAGTSCFPVINSSTNRSGLWPFLAVPWLLAALPRGRRLRGGLLFLALLLALFAPVNPNEFGSRFVVVVLAAFAVLWGVRAARSLWLVAALLIASLLVDGVFLRWRLLPEISRTRGPDRNARIAAAVGSRTLWLLNGAMSADAEIAGRRADVRFEYFACRPDHDWVRSFKEIREMSPWLLLNTNVDRVGTGLVQPSVLFPTCPGVPVAELQHALTAAGWRMAFEEEGYQVWSADDRTTEKNVERPGHGEKAGEPPGASSNSSGR